MLSICPSVSFHKGFKETVGRRACAYKGAISESDLVPKYPSLTPFVKQRVKEGVNDGKLDLL